jgi:hypothetical protein
MSSIRHCSSQDSPESKKRNAPETPIVEFCQLAPRQMIPWNSSSMSSPLRIGCPVANSRRSLDSLHEKDSQNTTKTEGSKILQVLSRVMTFLIELTRSSLGKVIASQRILVM